MRLRSYLLVLIGGILLPVLLFSAVMLVLFDRQTRAATEKGLVETARALSVAVDRELTASISVLRALATADSLASGDLKTFHRRMRAVLVSQPGWENIRLYDASGQQRLNTSRPFGEPLPRTANPELLIQAVRDRAPAVSNLFRGSVLGRPVVSVVVPVLAGDRVRYVLGMAFRPSVLSELLGAQGMPAGSIAALIDANGVFIARTREPLRTVGQPASPDFVRKMRASPDTAFRSVTIEGNDIYAGVSRSALSSWTVEIWVPAAAVDGPLRVSLWALAGIDALSVVVALMVGIPIARRLRRSIHSLSRAARTFVDGQWVDVPASGVSEIDEVVRSMERADRERQQIEATTAATAAVGQELTKTLDPGQVTNQVVTSVYRLFDIPRVNLYRADDPARGLTCVAFAGTGDPAEWLGAVLPWGTGTAGRAAIEERTISTRDLLRDPRIALPGWAAPRLQSDRFRGATSIPLTAGGRVVGVLTLGYETERTLTPRELRALNMFADQAAIALRNSELFEQERGARTAAEASERRARLLARLNQVISSTLDPDEVLAHITRAATELMDATFASFWVATEDGEGFEVRAWSSDLAARDFPLRTVASRQGIVGWVATERRSVNVADVFADDRFVALDWMRAHDLRSFIGVPVIHDGALLAVLGINGRAPFVLGREDERLLEAFSVQAAIAIQNARFVLALRVHQGRLETLLQVGRDIARIQPTTSLLTSLAEAGSRLLDTDAVGFRLVEGDRLVLVATSGGADEIMAPEPNPIAEGLTGEVARTGEPLTVLDAANDARCLPYGREAAARLGYRGWLGVPIKVGDRVTGVLSAWTRRPTGFSADDLTIVAALASQAAVALENDRLYQELERSYRELTQTQAQLMQSQKMEAIGQLAGGIAHDFNNLLTVITGRTIVALSQSAPGSALHRHLELVKQSADRAAALTHQLLAYSRRQVLQPKVLDLNAVIAGVAPMLQRLIGEDIELRIVRGEGLWPIRVDPGQIEQVIMNLSVNARDAMPDGGRLLIEAANVELGQAPSTMSDPVAEGPYVMLKVEDTGTGMDEETQRRIFEPFFTTKEVGQGTGLGLATVQGVVSQHGGAVRVYSAPGKGTTFKIYLPRAEGSMEATTGADVRQAPLGKGTILLVEDETEVRRLARQVMETAGYTVLEAHEGNEALALCQRNETSIDLLLTDVIMPGMSGRELADRLTTMRPTMKVLFVSGYTDDRLGRHGVLEPGVEFLAKPFSPAELLERIHEALGTR